MEKIEHRTPLSIPFGEMNIFETNISCQDIPFYFESPVITLMLNGNKEIRYEDEIFHFEEKNVYIPPCNQQLSIDISSSKEAPTKCVVLAIEEDYIGQVFYDVIEHWHPDWKETGLIMRDHALNNFVSSEENLWKSITQLYQRRIGEINAEVSDYLLSLNLNELIYELLKTKARHLLLNTNDVKYEGGIERVILYIKENFRNDITIRDLALVAGMSQANLFKKFKASFNFTPVEYIIELRIDHAKKLLISNPDIDIKSICYESGFKTLEYFYRKFNQMTGKSPKQYKFNGKDVS